MEEESEYLKLPIDEQCIHKSWKARINGYEESKKLFLTIDDEKSAEFTKYAPLMKKFVTDANTVAQEKALDAVLLFVENAHIAGKIAGEVVSGIVAKCLNSPKRNTQDKAIDVILMFCEIEKHEIVQEEIMKGFSQKNPKVVCNCIRAMTSALRDFGNKVISIKLLVKCMGNLLEDRDKNVREETKKMVVEMYRWAGPALTPQLKSLKPIQIQELESAFEKISNDKPTPCRYLRSQQQRQAKAGGVASSEADDAEDEEENEAEEVDPFELMTAVNILDNLPKDFYEKAESKKWQERKEALGVLLNLTQDAKLEAGDYADLIKLLKKTVAKDSNVMIVTIASQCLCGLAKGLKKKFSPYSISCMETIIEKFKEKKVNVVTALREAIDAVFLSTNIEAIQEIACNALKNKNPSVKAETASFLARAFCYCTPDLLNKKMTKAYSAALLVTLNESDPTVRDNSAEALGAMMKVVGEKGIMPFLADVDALKMPKIKQSCENAVLKVKIRSKPKSAPPPSKAPQEAKPKVVRGGVRPKTTTGTVAASNSKKDANASSKNKSVQNGNEEETGEEEMTPPALSSSKAKGSAGKPRAAVPSRGIKKAKPVSSRSGASSLSQRQEESDTSPLLQVNDLKHQRALDEQRLKSLRWEFTSPRLELISQLKEQMVKAELNENLLSKMFHTDFKFHIQAIDALSEHLNSNVEACISNLDLILRWLTIRFFDTNPSVIMRAMDYLNNVFGLLSARDYVMTDYEARAFLPFLTIKLGDPKESIRGSTKDIIKTICHIYAASKTFPYISNGLSVKNARQRAECLEVIRSFIENFGVSVCQPTPSAALKEVAKQVADRDTAVRNAALNCLLQVYYEQDEKLYKLIGTISDRDRSLLEERIKRSAKNKRPVISKPAEPTTEAKSEVINSKSAAAVIRPAIPAPPIRNRSNLSERTKPKPTAEQESSSRHSAYLDLDQFEKLLNETPASQPAFEVPSYITERIQRAKNASSADNENVKNANVTVDNSSQAILSVISQVSSSDANTVVSSMSQLHEVIRSPEVQCRMTPHLNQLLVMVSFQLRHVLDTMMSGVNASPRDATRIFKCVINFLISMLSVESLAAEVSTVALQDTIRVCLDVLMDSRLSSLDDSLELVRSMNVLVLRFIQKSNFTNVFSAVLKLLHEAVRASTNSKYLALVVKCNWQAIRRLRTSSKEDVNPVLILQHVNEFLEAFPSNTWANRSTDSPLQTVKLVLSEMVKLYNGDILTHMARVPNGQDSECQRYLIKNWHKRSANEKKDGNGTSSEAPLKSSDGQVPSNRKFSKSETDELCEIFNKIGTKETTKEGLRQLYDFTKAHPDADISACLRNSSQRLRNYIERGLKRVEMEEQQQLSKCPPESSSFSSEVGSSGALSSINDLVDEFKEIATQAGFNEPFIDSAVKNIRGPDRLSKSPPPPRPPPSSSFSSCPGASRRNLGSDDVEKENVEVLTATHENVPGDSAGSIETLVDQFKNVASDAGLDRTFINSMVERVLVKEQPGG